MGDAADDVFDAMERHYGDALDRYASGPHHPTFSAEVIRRARGAAAKAINHVGRNKHGLSPAAIINGRHDDEPIVLAAAYAIQREREARP